ncbi:hypothetical protein C8R44DRAFT_892619 [Mycena epipterygia]|nr:hypothetical protein C8R44DRAFT_892619 [Mycena epipterygia]
MEHTSDELTMLFSWCKQDWAEMTSTMEHTSDELTMLFSWCKQDWAEMCVFMDISTTITSIWILLMSIDEVVSFFTMLGHMCRASRAHAPPKGVVKSLELVVQPAADHDVSTPPLVLPELHRLYPGHLVDQKSEIPSPPNCNGGSRSSVSANLPCAQFHSTRSLPPQIRYTIPNNPPLPYRTAHDLTSTGASSMPSPELARGAAGLEERQPTCARGAGETLDGGGVGKDKARVEPSVHYIRRAETHRKDGKVLGSGTIGVGTRDIGTDLELAATLIVEKISSHRDYTSNGEDILHQLGHLKATLVERYARSPSASADFVPAFTLALKAKSQRKASIQVHAQAQRTVADEAARWRYRIDVQLQRAPAVPDAGLLFLYGSVKKSRKLGTIWFLPNILRLVDGQRKHVRRTAPGPDAVARLARCTGADDLFALFFSCCFLPGFRLLVVSSLAAPPLALIIFRLRLHPPLAPRSPIFRPSPPLRTSPSLATSHPSSRPRSPPRPRSPLPSCPSYSFLFPAPFPPSPSRPLFPSARLLRRLASPLHLPFSVCSPRPFRSSSAHLPSHSPASSYTRRLPPSLRPLLLFLQISAHCPLSAPVPASSPSPSRTFPADRVHTLPRRPRSIVPSPRARHILPPSRPTPPSSSPPLPPHSLPSLSVSPSFATSPFPCSRHPPHSLPHFPRSPFPQPAARSFLSTCFHLTTLFPLLRRRSPPPAPSSSPLCPSLSPCSPRCHIPLAAPFLCPPLFPSLSAPAPSPLCISAARHPSSPPFPLPFSSLSPPSSPSLSTPHLTPILPPFPSFTSLPASPTSLILSFLLVSVSAHSSPFTALTRTALPPPTSTPDDLVPSTASLRRDSARIDQQQQRRGYVPPAAPAFEAFAAPGVGTKIARRRLPLRRLGPDDVRVTSTTAAASATAKAREDALAAAAVRADAERAERERDPCPRPRTVVLPPATLRRFLAIARANMARDLETRGFREDALRRREMLIPKRHATSDTCTMGGYWDYSRELLVSHKCVVFGYTFLIHSLSYVPFPL